MPVIHQPGSYSGPCYEPCDHLGCEHDRWVASQPCAVCAVPIGCGLAYDVELDGSLPWAAIVQLGYQPTTFRHRQCVERAMAELDTDELDTPELAAAIADANRRRGMRLVDAAR